MQTDTPNATGAAKRRIYSLDLMRGYFILVIASVHLAYYPSFLGLFDGRGELWVSEAEGFFLISGLLIGIIRRTDISRHGYNFAVRKMLARGFKLYAASIVLTLAYIILAAITRSFGFGGAKDGLDIDSSTWTLLLRVLTLNYSYGWADFLSYYAAFMLTAPLLLAMLYKRLWWLVGLISLSLWVLRWSGDYGPWNPFLQWQVYFFLGSIIGYYWHDINRFFSAIRPSTRLFLAKSAMITSALTVLTSAFIVFTPSVYATRDLPAGKIGHLIVELKNAPSNRLYDSLLLHGRVGLLRPLIALIVFGGLFALFSHNEARIMRFFGKLLLPLGQNSLYVYIVQSAWLFVIPFIFRSGSFWLNTAIEAAIIGVTYLMVTHRFLFRIIPR